jgi:hypothetical protein
MTTYVRKAYDSVKNNIYLGWKPLRIRGPRLQPAKPIGKSGGGALSRILQLLAKTIHYNA